MKHSSKLVCHPMMIFSGITSTLPGRLGALNAPADATSRPTAILARSDEIAIGVMTATREIGTRRRENLHVIGIDGNPLGKNSGLPTINQHPSRQGFTATSEVLAQLE